MFIAKPCDFVNCFDDYFPNKVDKLTEGLLIPSV